MPSKLQPVHFVIFIISMLISNMVCTLWASAVLLFTELTFQDKILLPNNPEDTTGEAILALQRLNCLKRAVVGVLGRE